MDALTHNFFFGASLSGGVFYNTPLSRQNVERKVPKPYISFSRHLAVLIRVLLIHWTLLVQRHRFLLRLYPPICFNTNCAAWFWYLERYVKWTVVSKPESQKGSLKSQYDWIRGCRVGLYCWLGRRGNNPFLKDVPTSKDCPTRWRGSPIWMMATTK